MNVARQNNNVLRKGNTDLITINQIGNGLKFNGTNGISNGQSVSVPTYSAVQFTESSTFSISAVFTILSFNPNGNYAFQNYQQDSGMFGTVEGYTIIIAPSQIKFYEISNASLGGVGFNTLRANTVGEILNINIIKIGNAPSNWQLYINGILQNVNTEFIGTTAPITTFYNFKFAGFPESGTLPDFFSNMIWYDFKVFNKALNQSEVTQLYNSGHNNIAGLESNMVMNVNFNNKQGTLVENKPTANITGFANGLISNYSGAETSLGINNKWVNSLGNSITY